MIQAVWAQFPFHVNTNILFYLCGWVMYPVFQLHPLSCHSDSYPLSCHSDSYLLPTPARPAGPCPSASCGPCSCGPCAYPPYTFSPCVGLHASEAEKHAKALSLVTHKHLSWCHLSVLELSTTRAVFFSFFLRFHEGSSAWAPIVLGHVTGSKHDKQLKKWMNCLQVLGIRSSLKNELI